MKQRSRTEYSLINIFTGILGYGINTVVGFVCRIIFVRTLSADYLGVSGLFSNILSVLSLAELGISSAIVFELYKPIAQNDTKKISSIMQFYRKAYAGIGITVAIMGLLIMPFLGVIIQEPPDIKENINLLYILYLVNTVTSYYFSYRSSLLIAMQRQYIVSGYSYVTTIGQSVIQVVLLLLTHEYLLYLLIQIIGGITYNVWVSYKAGKDYEYIKERNVEKLSSAEVRSLLSNVKALAINKLSGVLVNSTDNIVITYFSGLISTGMVSNYTLFTNTLDKLVTQSFSALTGSVGNYNATADDETRYSFFKILNFANFWLYGWAAIGIAFVSSDLVYLFYGKEYVMNMSIPMIIAINFFTIGMLHASYTYKSTLGLFRYGQYILLFTGLINLILDVILGKLWGIVGIYVATLIARACTSLWYEPYAVYRYGLKKPPILYFQRYLFFSVVLIGTGLLCCLVCSWCNFSAVGNVLIKCVICTVIPNIIFYMLFRKTEEFIYLKQKIKTIIGRLLHFSK